MKFITNHLIYVIMVLLPFTLIGCKKEEQGRPLSYNKGIYEGDPDNSLTENNVYNLKKRTAGQSWY